LKPEVAPSILSADFANLARDIRVVEDAGAKILHVDVMDGHFVPNLTIGLPALESIRKTTDLLIDVHLMISNPDTMAVRFAEAGADFVTVHYEAATHLDQILTQVRENGAMPGAVLNPHTPVSVLEEILPKCEMVLIMSVNPGYGGQEFISTSFDKVRKLRKLVETRGLNVRIEIDGGIGLHNTAEAVYAGVDVIVAGSAIFHSKDPASTYREMQRIAERVNAELRTEV
jgi:ribulose-phosphate 3-epimerase